MFKDLLLPAEHKIKYWESISLKTSKCQRKLFVVFENRKMDIMTQGRQSDEAKKPKKRLSNGLEFELKFSSQSKNEAKREARKYRKRGFHTRVRESYPGIFSVYRRSKSAE